MNGRFEPSIEKVCRYQVQTQLSSYRRRDTEICSKHSPPALVHISRLMGSYAVIHLEDKPAVRNGETQPGRPVGFSFHALRSGPTSASTV